jgi:DNA-binding transcriptional LysR family regulator
MESAAEAITRAAACNEDAISGPVRIAASHVIGAEVLPAILTPLVDRHPELAIELVLSNRSEDLLRRDADIAVRMTRPTQSALLSRWIGEVRLGLYATGDYLAGRSVPKTFTELARDHRMIGFDRDPIVLESLEALGLRLRREDFALRIDNDLAQIAALRAGYGVGVCQVNLAARDPRLVRLLPDAFSSPLGIWLVMHEDLKAQTNLRVVYDHLAEGLLAYLREPADSTKDR